MTRREVILAAVRYEYPPYVPWHVSFTAGPRQRLAEHYGCTDLDTRIDNHMITYRPPTRRFAEISPGIFRDMYGSVWDRRVDRDIGVLQEPALKRPNVTDIAFPECRGGEEQVRELLADHADAARHVSIGFAMFERAWGLRGMENLLIDFMERPQFVHELLDAIMVHDLQIVEWALQFDPDIVHFGDDWGQQHGLIMGPALWRQFIKPRIAKLYEAVHDAGKIVSIHTCGDVREILDELVEIGVDLFNPFQPEVMDVVETRTRYHGRLAFHGGMSIQRILPFGSADDVRRETQRLIEKLGTGGGYVFAPAHAVPDDVSVENILAFLEVLQQQPGFRTA